MRPVETRALDRLALDAAFNSLTRYETLILCLYGLGLTQAEIGAGLDTHPRTVSSQLARAREKLWRGFDETNH